jgi:menaquinol-cytochrome c reductase iron-sulfur subunit
MEKKSRRSFLTKLGQFFFGAGILATTWPYLRSLVPNVLYEPPKRFKIGKPDKFTQGVTFLDERRVFIFRDGDAFNAISGICTHLGCTVKYSPFSKEKEITVKKLTYKSKGEFHCSCHGSSFYDEGTNYAGPAPKPLQSFLLELSPEDGQIIVNFSNEVNRDFRLVV